MPHKHTTTPTLLSKLPLGQTFLHGDSFYMRVHPAADRQTHSLHYLNLTTGYIFQAQRDFAVYPSDEGTHILPTAFR